MSKTFKSNSEESNDMKNIETTNKTYSIGANSAKKMRKFEKGILTAACFEYNLKKEDFEIHRQYLGYRPEVNVYETQMLVQIPKNESTIKQYYISVIFYSDKEIDLEEV